MAQGAGAKGISKHIRWYYTNSGQSRPAMPANLAAAAALCTDANQFLHTMNDQALPPVNAPAAAPGNVTWREQGADEEVSTVDIRSAADAGAQTFEIQWQCDWTNTLHRTMRSAAADTYAVLICDIQTDKGTAGARTTTSGSAEGTLIAIVVQHADATVTPVASASPVSATTSFTVVASSDNPAKQREFFDYGEA